METKSLNLELYVAPEVEMLEVRVEVGFAGSGDFNDGPTIEE